jgi:hypothetical protein
MRRAWPDHSEINGVSRFACYSEEMTECVSAVHALPDRQDPPDRRPKCPIGGKMLDFSMGWNDENRTSANVRSEEEVIGFQWLGATRTGRPAMSEMSD